MILFKAKGEMLKNTLGVECQVIRGGFSVLGPQANLGMGPYTFAQIYLDQPRGFFFVVMLAAAQWCPIVSNVSTFCML